MQNNRVLFIYESSADAAVAQGLIEAGYVIGGCHGNKEGLQAKLLASKPDLLVLCVTAPTEGLLAELKSLSETKALPIVLFVESSDATWMNKAVAAGVSSYIYKGLEPIRIPAILEMAKLRFAQVSALKLELQEAQDKLKSRVLVDRAKGMLMEYQKITEQQAYRTLQKTAMDQATSMVDIARQTITVLSNMHRSTVSAVVG